MQGKHGSEFEAPDRVSGPTMTSPALGRRRGGFTLTELLIVIAIIGVLASLITAAAIRALNTAKRARIVLEINNISTATEKFRTDLGAYPPSAMNLGNNPTLPLVVSDLERMARKAFPRINAQELEVFKALAGPGNYFNTQVVTDNSELTGGLSAAEAIVFWFGGFSSDPQFPLSGPGGPSFLAADAEVLENRNWAGGYEFNLGNLGPKDESGQPDPTQVRFVQYRVMNNGVQQDRQINFWTYRPSGSEQPLLYFDTSRYSPSEYDMPAVDPTPGQTVYAIKAYRTGYRNTGNGPQLKDIVFANPKKFQILHSGLDDAWGDEEFYRSSMAQFQEDPEYFLTYPDGPYLNEMADTLTNFSEGELQDNQPE